MSGADPQGRSLLQRGARKVVAAARDAAAAEALRELDPGRVQPLVLDVTDSAQVAAAVSAAGDVSLLINNAGSLASFSVLDEPLAVRMDLEVNIAPDPMSVGVLATWQKDPAAVARQFAS